jgi:hypothetical protein
MASTRKEGEQLYADINAGGRTHLDVETTDFNVLVAGAKYTCTSPPPTDPGKQEGL